MINTNLYSDDALLALEEVDAIYQILQKKYEGMPSILMAAMLSGVLTRIDSDKSLFTAIELTHKDARVWHPKFGFGKVQNFDENKKAIIKFDGQPTAIKLSPKVMMLAEDMEDFEHITNVAEQAAAIKKQENTPDASIGG